MSISELETQLSSDIPSHSEDLSLHSISPGINLEQEEQQIYEKFVPMQLSQGSTQPDLYTDIQLDSSTITFSPEKNSEKKTFRRFDKKPLKLTQNNFLQEIQGKNDIYTQEESENEEEINEKKNGIEGEPKKKIKLFEDTDELKNKNLYTQEESEDDQMNEESNKIKENASKKNRVSADINEIIDDSEEEGSQNQSILLPKKRKQNYKKITSVPLKTFNKLVEIKQDSFIDVGGAKEIGSDEEITVSPKRKTINNSFFDKIKLNKSDKFNFTLAKAILTDTSQHESLEITAPTRLDGFVLKKKTTNPRELLRESLKSEINQRKTTHIDNEIIFSKTISDLPGKLSQKEEDNESDYIPEDNEESEALEMEKIIKLEEGSEDNSDKNEASDSEENSEEELSPEKDIEMKTTTEDIELIPEESKLVEEQANPEENQAMDIDEDSSSDLSASSSNESSSSTESKGSELVKGDKLSEIKTFTAISTTDNSPAILQVFSSKIKASKFIDTEAEVGSDHEEHDDLIKNLKDSDIEDMEDGKDLEELIDRNHVDDDEEMRMNKHMQHLIQDDELQMNKVINADFRRQRKDIDFIDATNNIMSKKQKLLEEKKTLLANREKNIFSRDLEEIHETEEMDDEEYNKFRMLQGSQQLKFIRNQFDSKIILDDQSLSYLSLITKPDNTIGSKSLLSDSEKSNSIRVFKTSSNLSSNRSFVFSKNKEKIEEMNKQTQKKTKLYKLLTN